MYPEEMKDLARRIAERAAARKIVQLSPETALTVARVLHTRAARPMRWKIIAAMCQLPNCKDRRDCYSCIAKANAVERLYEDEYRVVMEGRAYD